MFSKLFVAAVLAVSAQSAIATCSKSYTVQQGDYCDKISQAQNVSTYQLAVLNSNAINSACSNLLPGQTLCLADNADEDCNTTYVVLKDDTCDGIAAKNGLNTTILSLNNPQINDGCSNIYLGEVLCTSKDVRVAPVPAAGVSVVAPATTIVVTPTAKPTPTPAAASTSVAVSTPTATPKAATPAPAQSDEDCDDDSSSNDDQCDDDAADEDDDDLPFCDEL
ncbi:hypothetical protein BDN70DRAFT_446300 [Pholiota conissans]|uniref:LysM domain-containing protein n=1 Tax=Pholiota conissans TaxID=109636 RepID=A0A9P6CMT3_9AGAR|nr:hypothetical protein BDN70DRAFT_446300 [Pholiota conissans]